MKFVRFTMFFLAITWIYLPVNAQNMFEGWEYLFQPKKNYVVYSTSETMTIDGKADETSWEKVEWTDLFTDIEGSNKKTPEYSTKVKMLWDKHHFYILAELTEPHIWAYYKKHDKIVYHENDFEVFLDPDRNTHEYFEFEINAQNTLFDLFMTKPYRDGGIPLISWDAGGFQSAVFVHGTLNQPNDTDKCWVLEMAIPFYDLRLGVHPPTPADGTYWNINFSRVQWQTDVTESKYVRRTDKTSGQILPENNWVWSPVGIINMHFPERWGLVQFSEMEAGKGTTPFVFPAEEKYRDYLWLLYYKQSEYKKAHKKYAATLDKLALPENPGQNTRLSMNAGKMQFFAVLNTPEGWTLTINHEGKIQITKSAEQ
jgi:hypothetical protein